MSSKPGGELLPLTPPPLILRLLMPETPLSTGVSAAADEAPPLSELLHSVAIPDAAEAHARGNACTALE